MSTVYKYIGGGAFMMAVPARDLMPEDLIEVGEREGITEAQIVESGLYVPMEDVEVGPFCGMMTGGGERCREPVEDWGERCEEHGG